MELLAITGRRLPAIPAQCEGKIPWNDPGFSRRMLANHLSQDHDWASRRQEIVDRHVAWIAGQLTTPRARVLDLGCGPGLYTHALAQRGYRCTGMDFSPASIDYARQRAQAAGLPIDYLLADIRDYRLDGGFDLAMITFGEINVFRCEDALAILANAVSLLAPEGMLLAEVHAFDEVRRQGEAAPSWQAMEEGLFSARPHLLLQENFWDSGAATATSRYFVIDAADASVTEYGSVMQAYAEDEYLQLFRQAGLRRAERVAAEQWPAGDAFTGKLSVYRCRK